MDLTVFLQLADHFGVPVAFAILMYFLLIHRDNKHSDERKEWREFVQGENALNRATIDKLSDVVSNISIQAAGGNIRPLAIPPTPKSNLSVPAVTQEAA